MLNDLNSYIMPLEPAHVDYGESKAKLSPEKDKCFRKFQLNQKKLFNQHLTWNFLEILRWNWSKLLFTKIVIVFTWLIQKICDEKMYKICENRQ